MTAPSLHQHPAWFGSVMGTAALAVALAQSVEALEVLGWLSDTSGVASALDVFTQVMLVIASVLALVLTPRYLTRSRDRAALQHEIADPAHGAMLATFPAGLLVLAVAWGRIGPELLTRDVALVVSGFFIIVGTAGAIALSVLWASAQGRGDAQLAGIHGGWLIPPVMSLLVPLALAPFVVAFPEQAAWLVVMALAFYGVGIFLFLSLFSLLIARLALRPPLANAMSPSLWIPLAPAGIMGLALIKITSAGADAGLWLPAIVTLGIVISAMGIGLGLWWTLFALGDLLRVRRGGGLPFHPGWWSFVFPIAAMQLSITALGLALDTAPVLVAGLVIFVVLIIIWLGVAIRTSQAVLRHRAPRT